jgi:DNA-directed RNA polymerase subunit beta'
MVKDGDDVQAGDVLAKIPRETTKTKDITGGLPRVVELFETRKPKDPAVISEIDGVVKYGEISKGMRKIYVESEDGRTQKEYSIARGVHINVQEGEHVHAGEPLIDGPLNPHDLLAVPGEFHPGGLSSAGSEHQRQAHRNHRSPDDALGESRRRRRHQVLAGRTSR